MFVVQSSMTQQLQEFTWVTCMNVGQRQVAANLQAANLTCQSTHSPIAICIRLDKAVDTHFTVP